MFPNHSGRNLYQMVNVSVSGCVGEEWASQTQRMEVTWGGETKKVCLPLQSLALGGGGD